MVFKNCDINLVVMKLLQFVLSPLGADFFCTFILVIFFRGEEGWARMLLVLLHSTPSTKMGGGAHYFIYEINLLKSPKRAAVSHFYHSIYVTWKK